MIITTTQPIIKTMITPNKHLNIITCEENEVLSMFSLGNIHIYLPISANFFTKLGFKIFLGVKLEKKYKGECND